MRSMGINRRQLLGFCAAGVIVPGRVVAALPDQEALYVAARKYQGRFEAVLADVNGQVTRAEVLAGRGHSFAIDRRHCYVVAFPRHPGTEALAFSFDPARRHEPAYQFFTPANRRFSGHGVFSDDGRVLYAAENDYEMGRGVVGVYEHSARSGQLHRVDEWPTHGVGPHEIILDSRRDMLCVANGGLLTHPDYNKLVLNRSSMRADLTYLNARNGVHVAQQFAPKAWHKQSIRHLVLDHQQRVWVGCQYQGSKADQVPLVAFHGPEMSALQWVQAPEAVWHSMQHYVGSMAFDPLTQVIAASSPVGGVVAYWRADNVEFLASHAIPDGCGVAPAPQGGFVLNSGLGQWAFGFANHKTADQIRFDSAIAWDHHLRRV